MPLPDIRARIDAVDDEILLLLERRAALVAEAFACKRAHGTFDLHDEAREREIVDRLLQRSTLHLAEPSLREFVVALLRASQQVALSELDDRPTFAPRR